MSEGERYGRPSAPPISLSVASSTHAVQMKEKKAIHKEQETALMFSYHNQSTAGGETFFGRPPGRSAAIDIATGGRSQKGGRRGRGCWCCCLASFMGTLAAIVVIVGVAALVLYLVLKPKAPKYSVTEATVNEFKLTTGPPGSNSFNLNTDVVFSVEARNLNKKISLYYDDVTVKLLYADQQIGQGSISAFFQPHRNTTFLTLPIQGRQIRLASSSGPALQSSLQHDGSIPLQANAVSEVRVKIGRWKSRRYKIHVICSLQLSNLNTHVSVLSKSCKLKIKFGHITF